MKLLPTMFSGTEEMALDHGQLSHLVGGYDQLHQANLLSTVTAGVVRTYKSLFRVPINIYGNAS